jgi:hypothetical protein
LPDDGGVSSWAAALDDLELRATRAAQQQPLEQWQAGADGEALPAGLAERARDVLAAQSAAIEELRAQQRRIGSQLDALSTAKPARSDAPVYVDLIG